MRKRILVIVVLLLATARAQSSAAETTLASVKITSPADGARVTGTVTVKVTAPGGTSVTFHVDGTIIGKDTSAPYSFDWNTREAAVGRHELRVVARDATGSAGGSPPVSVIVESPTDKTPPTVSVTSPDDGAQVTGKVAIKATASDEAGVASVTFRVDGSDIGTDTSAPYQVSWDTSGISGGRHILRAEARDAAGNVGTSPPVSVIVGKSDNKLPTVAMTAPGDGTTHQAPATIRLAASATDADGSVSRVEFYEDSTLLGVDTTAPFTFTWAVSEEGTYRLSAHALDDDGGVAKSASVRVTVTNGREPSTAIFEPSANDSVVIRYVLEIFRNGVDPETGTPSATQNLGKPPIVKGECTADISQTLAALQPGTYVATVTAVGSHEKTRSAPAAAFVIVAGKSVVRSIVGVIDDAVDSMPSGRDELSTPSSTTETNGRLWVTNSSTSLVTAFNATTGDVLATIPVGLTPTGIAAPSGVGKVYVADEGSDTVSVISKATLAVVATIKLPPPFGRRPHHVRGSPDGRFVYVGELGANVVDVIDTATDQVVARFSAGWPGSTIRGIVPDQGGDVLYAVSAGATPSLSSLVAIDTRTGRWLWHLPINGDASDFVVGPDGRTGIVARRADRRLAVIDLERHDVVNDVDLGDGYEGGTLQLSADGRSLAIILRQTPVRVGVVDLAGIATVRPISLKGPATRTLLSAAQLSYVCVSDSSEFLPGVVAVDPASQTVVNRFRFPGGGSPHGVVFDP